ncbi:MAG: hypothetical protein SGCHY_003469 [Lobulomycetales sp.]
MIEHSKVQILEHPLVREKLSKLRNVETSSSEFRQTLEQLSGLLAIEASRDLTVSTGGVMLKSPLQVGYPEEKIQESVALFPILRAGLGLIPGFQAMFPVDAKTYHIGLYREKSTFLPVEYYNKLPGVCATDVGFVLDPMIATAGTAIAAVSILKDWGLKNIKFCAVVASRTGLDALVKKHPDIEIFVCAVDEVLDEGKYIVPGLGDAGDRIFGTKH